MTFQLLDNLSLIGKTIIKPDRSFSFNAYLLTGEQNILIDTVPERASEVFWTEVQELLPLEKLDALILNHSEEDHSGALPYLLDKRPDISIYCTEACANRLNRTYSDKLNYKVIHSGETHTFGTFSFTFYETPGLHWDDNMVTYWQDKNVLFSNDLFGQSIGSLQPLDSSINLERLEAATKEYLLKVFSSLPEEQKQIILELTKLPIDYIAPGHGLVIRDFVSQILSWYSEMV